MWPVDIAEPHPRALFISSSADAKCQECIFSHTVLLSVLPSRGPSSFFPRRLAPIPRPAVGLSSIRLSVYFRPSLFRFPSRRPSARTARGEPRIPPPPPPPRPVFFHRIYEKTARNTKSYRRKRRRHFLNLDIFDEEPPRRAAPRDFGNGGRTVAR